MDGDARTCDEPSRPCLYLSGGKKPWEKRWLPVAASGGFWSDLLTGLYRPCTDSIGLQEGGDQQHRGWG